MARAMGKSASNKAPSGAKEPGVQPFLTPLTGLADSVTGSPALTR